MIDIITTIGTNLFRTFIIKRFLALFFQNDRKNKIEEITFYLLFFLVTTAVHVTFHFPPANIITNLIMLYIVTQVYDGEQKKKILVSILIYGINMACDTLSVYSVDNYIVQEGYSEITPYITVLMICICEFIIEKFFIKQKEVSLTPPYWSILVFFPLISIAILFVLIMNSLNNRTILVLVSAGILLINMLIFFLYNTLVETYLRLEENTLFERQIASYANQLNVLMESEKRVVALRHDMKHHLNELLIMANKNKKEDIESYIENMQMFMENRSEYSKSGNKDVDSILNYILNQAQKVLDKVEYKINIPKEIGISVFDLNVILGNLLENAIRAAKRSEDKWLSIFIRFQKGMLFIDVKNSYNNYVIRKGKEYLTTKKETEIHGIGLQNVKRVVSNYNGHMEITDKDNVFEVKIMLYTLFKK